MTAQYTAPTGDVSYLSSDVASGEHHIGEKLRLLFDPQTGATFIDSPLEIYGSLLWFGITGALLVSVGSLSLLSASRARRRLLRSGI